ncbi:MAG: hypothetical protein RI943_841 [Bacteroidota bacterium]|jgi:hypothetical protein
MVLKCLGDKCKECPNHTELLDNLEKIDTCIDGCIGLKPYFINFDKKPLEEIQATFSDGRVTDFEFKLMPPVFRSI